MRKTYTPAADRVDVYERINSQIVEQLELGLKPWKRPWHTTGPSLPRRHTGEFYRGINVMVLWLTMAAQGYTSPYFMSYRRIAELGGQVRKGETATTVVYANQVTRREENEAGEDAVRSVFVYKAYPVFSVHQADGLPARFFPKPAPLAAPKRRIEGAEIFFRHTGADIRHGGDQAFYVPSRDYIRLPDFEAFVDAEAYYCTLAHEVAHWTGHKTRLNRDTVTRRYEAEARAVEELIAEIGACYVCASLGINPDLTEQSTAYIGAWLRGVANDKRFLFRAAAHAQRAADFLWQLQPGQEEP